LDLDCQSSFSISIQTQKVQKFVKKLTFHDASFFNAKLVQMLDNKSCGRVLKHSLGIVEISTKKLFNCDLIQIGLPI
jgi:hypothetical protein